jgi:Fur family transcriptional regulator, peroxide stress response regulator
MTNYKTTKTSRQRDLILMILRSTRNHPTADWIYEYARKEMPKISLGTVYRNLSVLKGEGRIQELSLQGGVSRFDGDMRDHYHVRCSACGRVEDVPHVSSRVSDKEIEDLTGFRIHLHSLEFIGLCPVCLDMRHQSCHPDPTEKNLN